MARSVEPCTSYHGALAVSSSSGVMTPPTSIVSLKSTMQESSVLTGPTNPPSTAKTSLSWVSATQERAASSSSVAL